MAATTFAVVAASTLTGRMAAAADAAPTIYQSSYSKPAALPLAPPVQAPSIRAGALTALPLTLHPRRFHVASIDQARRAVRDAYAQLGKPYVWGGNGPSSFDCSGLTRWVWRFAGVSIPRVSQQQARFGLPVRLSDIRIGDLVIYFPGRSHVGIYIGHGKIIVAPHPGARVHITGLRSMPISAIRRP